MSRPAMIATMNQTFLFARNTYVSSNSPDVNASTLIDPGDAGSYAERGLAQSRICNINDGVEEWQPSEYFGLNHQ